MVNQGTGQKGRKANKFVIAVHGCGDQGKYETIQTVAHLFCHYFDKPPAVPLGQIHSALENADAAGEGPHKHGIYLMPALPGIGFGEVYWADIPRGVANDGFVLEETKKWSKTIVDRLRSQDAASDVKLKEKDYATIKRVLSEMIETVNVLDWLSFLADKAGLFTFRLKQVLNDYVDDVQIVTEYEKYRAGILERFDAALSAAYKADQEAELYIVAHSEGSVVALLGLLNARSSPDREKYAWLRQVRGLMTIGSPIDKHIVFWEELFTPFAGRDGNSADPAPRIRWKNYYDHGDPIGSKLDIAREWLAGKGLTLFDFKQTDDHGYSRYLFPGKAHNDYWQDREVFGHFIGSVMQMEPSAKERGGQEPRKPASKATAVLGTYTVPYLLMFALLLVGTNVLYSFLTKDSVRPGNTIAVAALVAGLTVLTRVPRLTKNITLKILGATASFGFIGLFYLLASEEARGNIEAWSKFVLYLAKVDYDALFLGVPATSLGVCAAVLLITGAAYVASEFRPLWGLKPLIFIGGAATLAVAVLIMVTNTGDLKALADLDVLWQLALSSAIFLYAWWLAALLFDLVFVWHSYIRNERTPGDTTRRVAKEHI